MGRAYHGTTHTAVTSLKYVLLESISWWQPNKYGNPCNGAICLLLPTNLASAGTLTVTAVHIPSTHAQQTIESFISSNPTTCIT